MEMKNNIGHLRRSYDKYTLEESDLEKTPINLFEKWFQEAAQNNEIDEPNAMTVSTLGRDGFPRGRVVLLKAFSPSGFVFYTNYTSEKGKAIAKHSKVGLSFFWPSQQRQIHVHGKASKLLEEESETYFQSRPRGSQLGAWVSPQSQVIEDRGVLESSLYQLQKKYKDKPIPKPKHWGGYIVAPQDFEFWQGRPNRLHDRIRYFQVDSEWKYERLAP